MTAPRATVRLQLHSGFTLDDARDWVPYFARLGISHVYTSPITRARAGSMHGYDVLDHTQVNPELGGEKALRALVARLREFDMGLIVDIVPNHMATSTDNPWWRSVLESGQSSPHAEWFDIAWEFVDPELRGKVLAPFLGKPYGEALEGGDLKLAHDAESGRFYLDVYGTSYPLCPESLRAANLTDPATLGDYDAASESGRQRLHELLERQHYRLAWWRAAPEEINWRRFFEISDLIGVRVDRPEVFDAVHALTLRFYEEGLIDGVRVDHVDGLSDPIGYCARLREALAERTPRRPAGLPALDPYLVVEKILADDETLDERWKVDGTTGYDFLSQVSAVLHDPAGEATLTELWERVSRDGRPFAAVAAEARDLMLLRHFPAERFAAARALHRVARMDLHTRDWGESAILRVLWQLLAVFPVYRTYADDHGWHHMDRVRFEHAATQAHARIRLDRDGDDAPLLDLMTGWLGAEAPEAFEPAQRDARREAIRRFQQLTPPLTAKSLEDTAFYRYGRLLSRNEVGADPGIFSMPVDVFHRRCAARGRHFPRAMVATATHDHKRGEDTRSRLAVLSEFPGLWADTVQTWMSRHAPATYNGTGVLAPHPADLYMLLQCLVGAWPLSLRPDDEAGLRAFGDRVSAWQQKSLREAKLRTSWVVPDAEYEAACEQTLRSLLQPGTDPGTPACEIAAFVARIAPAGIVNSLAQTVLRMTVPGVPDLYQGTEFWDFSLVDPDNRAPVDYAARAAALDAPDATDPEALLADWRSGRLKQAVVRGALAARRARPDIFELGGHVPLPVLGTRGDRVLAFVRCVQDRCVFTLVPRLCAQGLRTENGDDPDAPPTALPRIDPAFWETTAVVLPHRYAGATLRDALSGRERRVGADSILPLAEALADFPVAVLVDR
ncbi:malto-oligosyltrehalose synthase [Bordetella flabilis]|uniref:Malto-oligosyltrehalose synthase n=1 Tax=Bordetella flabilis TaxID=463014 RepID=A0A193GDP6_9BORD|nr:malto-oligosyltrehalose synthase [Bordetella flabilis]ANN77576.1 malto-oligosyltrehalose synthase [Bordetella flabilis]